jgi:hypothetical protein
MRSPWHEDEDTMNLCLRFLVPYAAVLVFWYDLGNAWFTIAAYHLLILLFARGRIPLPTRPPNRMHLVWALPAILAGPLLYLLFPLMLVSHLWGVLGRQSKSLTPAYVSHALADFSIVIAAWMRT